MFQGEVIPKGGFPFFKEKWWKVMGGRICKDWTRENRKKGVVIGM